MIWVPARPTGLSNSNDRLGRHAVWSHLPELRSEDQRVGVRLAGVSRQPCQRVRISAGSDLTRCLEVSSCK